MKLSAAASARIGLSVSIGIFCGTALTRMNRQLNRTIRQLIELRTTIAPVE